MVPFPTLQEWEKEDNKKESSYFMPITRVKKLLKINNAYGGYV